jgi:Flp pilus assembly protein CpaB
VLSAVGSYSVYQTRPVVEHSVVVAIRDIAPGTVLGRGDLGTRATVAEDTWVSALVPGQDLDSLVGRVAPEPLHAGLPVARAQVAPREQLAPDQQAVALPVGPTNAALGSIQVGDWVQVWATPRAQGARTVSVLDRVRVIDLAFGDSARTSVGGSSTARGVTALLLALRPDEARALIEMARTSAIDVARLPSSATAAGSNELPAAARPSP